MGKTRTTVGTSVNRVIEDDRVPSSVKTGVVKAVMQNGEIVDHVLDELTSSIGLRAERMYDYAKNGGYTWGTPSGQFTSGVDARNAVATVLAALEGAAVTLDYAQHGAPNNLHIGWMKLIADHGYNPANNQLAGLSASLGTTVWLEDMQIVVPSAGAELISPKSLAQWGMSPKAGYTPRRASVTDAVRAMIGYTPPKISTVASEEHLLVVYTRLVGPTAVTGTFTIPVTGYDDDLDYYHARYTVGGVVKYWMYRDGLGTYPVLDELFDKPPEINGTFFPFIYFRWNFDSEVDDPLSAGYASSKKMVKYLGMDYDIVGEGINANPDIDDVKQAIMMFAVPGNTTDPIERRYLFDFFENVFLANEPVNQFGSEKQGKIYDALNEQMYVAAPAIVIQDTRFKMTVDNEGIYMRKVAGTIGAVGSYTSGFDNTVQSVTYKDSVTGLDVVVSAPAKKVHYYRHQIAVGIYEEIRVVNMRTMFHIFGKYKTIGDNLDEFLLIPMDHSITDNWSIPDREILYARSLHYVFNSVIVTKVKWYETGIFKVVMLIVAVAVTIWSMGGTAVLLAALVSSGAYVLAAALILDAILTFVLFSVAFKMFVKVVGVKVAFIIAIVAAVAGVGLAINAGSLSGAPFASELLSVSTGLSKAVDGQLGKEVQELYEQGKEFDLYKADQLKILDTAEDLLKNDVHLNPFVIFGEKPDDFYNRTVHSGNIGVLGGIESISSYVDMKLRLPKLQDSLNEGD